MSRKVEELEATISELESTVQGLTEELVDTKEKLRVIEEELGIDVSEIDQHRSVNVKPEYENTVGSPQNDTNQVDNPTADQESTEANERIGEDIIVA